LKTPRLVCSDKEKGLQYRVYYGVLGDKEEEERNKKQLQFNFKIGINLLLK